MAQAEKQQAPPQEDVEKLIIVTGFGPFTGHEDVNASWEAVKLLPDEVIYDGTSYKLEKQMIDVEYAAVDKAVQNIWSRRPALVIHCGVHGMSDCIRVERQAYNHCFKRPDYAGNYLPSGSACLQHCPRKRSALFCQFDVERIVDVVSESCGCTPSATDDKRTTPKLVQVSKNVGNYLCGYIYLKSLDMDCRRSLFVHVPPVDKPLSSAKTANVVFEIIAECLRQVTQ